MLFQWYIPGEDNPNEIIFHVTIGSAKKTDLIYFHLYAPAIKYLQHNDNNCVFSSLAYTLFDYREHVTEKDFAYQLE